MSKSKKANSALRLLELVPAVASWSRTNRDRQDHLIIAPWCCLCGQPITNFDEALIFGLLEEESDEEPRRIGTIVAGRSKVPLLTAPHKLHAGHTGCIDKAEARREFCVCFRHPLSAVLKSDQQTDRDRALEGKPLKDSPR